MKLVCKLRQGCAALFGVLVASVLSTTVHAQGLPTTAPPSRGSTAGNFIELLQNYAFDIAIFGGLALSTIVLFVVAKNVLSTYSEISDGRATWGQLGIQAVAGVLLLVFIIFLMTEAANIL